MEILAKVLKPKDGGGATAGCSELPTTQWRKDGFNQQGADIGVGACV